MLCQSCQIEKPNTKTALVDGVYYKAVCAACLGTEEISSLVAAHNRHRDYEDNAQDTIQPYDAAGNGRSEFLRLYPVAAAKIYSPEVIEELKRKL